MLDAKREPAMTPNDRFNIYHLSFGRLYFGPDWPTPPSGPPLPAGGSSGLVSLASFTGVGYRSDTWSDTGNRDEIVLDSVFFDGA